MVEFVSVDASRAEQGNRTFLVGVAIEVSNGGEFDDYYFHRVDEFCDRYGIELGHSILKAKHILESVPSFSVRAGENELVRELVQNPAIRRIHVSIGWYGEEVEFGESSEEMSGIQFATNHLHHYFPIATLWRYHREHPDWDQVPDEAWIDNIQGKITKCWKYVGNEFDLQVVPHGDITYPSLSTADIVANHLARTLPRDKPFRKLPNAAKGTLVSYVDGPMPRVSADEVNSEYEDHVVPRHRYTINSELHFPHPVTFVYDEIFSHLDQGVLPDTDFHAYLRAWAQEHAGCVVNLEPHRMPSMVKSGDRIVYTSGTDPEMCRLLSELNPTKDIDILDSAEVVDNHIE